MSQYSLVTKLFYTHSSYSEALKPLSGFQFKGLNTQEHLCNGDQTCSTTELKLCISLFLNVIL